MYSAMAARSGLQHDRVDELNDRILGRAFDNRPVQPAGDVSPRTPPSSSSVVASSSVYDPRSVSTKYTVFHTMDRLPKIPLAKPPAGERVETETDLHGRRERIGVYDTGSKYRPSLESDMYKVTVGNPVTDQPPAERALLFARPTFAASVHPNMTSTQIGSNLFANHTRTQLRGS